MLRSRRPSRPFLAALTGLATLFSVVALVAPAQAAIKAPGGLVPGGFTASSTPTFSWNRVTGAASYQFLADDNSDFSSPLVTVSTANNKVVPTTNLPDGLVFWRVRAVSASSVNSAWAGTSVTVSGSASPSLISPVGGVVLSQPDSPPLFSWSAVNGAVGYEIQVDNSGSWNTPTTYSSHGNSYFVNTPQSPGTWFWRVRANRGNGLFTAWSGTGTYVVGRLADPTPGPDMNTGSPVQDVSIDWQPVAGATQYQLQVGRDPDFNNLVDDRIVDGTRFQPTTTYDNDQYYWRVRAIDAGGNRMPWTTAAPFTFQRNWPQKPTLEYPPNQLVPTVGDPMYFQWTPVRHATTYQLDVSADSNFSPGQYFTCTTSGTTFPIGNPPGGANSCGSLSSGQTLYWRVRAIDGPRSVQGIYSDIHSFVYNAGQVTQTSPTNGAVVDVPTLTWNALRETQQYEVILRDKNNSVVADTTTYSTSWTPEAKLDTTKNPYSWSVQAIDASGARSPLYPSRTFSVSGNDPTFVQPPLTQLTGTSSDSPTSDFPNLSWVPVTGATSYTVSIGVHGSGFFDATNTSHINGTAYPYPAATDTGAHYLNPGQYDWFVTAATSGGPVSSASLATFTVRGLASASGQQVALDGLASQAGHTCTYSLSGSADQQICTGVPSTPVLSWNPVPGAAGYIVYLANDQELTNLVVPPSTTTNTMWRPPADLQDNTAQDSYYWYVRPCKSLSPLFCNADPISTNAAATNAFRKLSPAIALQSPADGASLTGQPSFSWADYYDTNQTVTYPASPFTPGADPSYQTAQSYRIQISQSPNFTSTVDQREVDQPFYTPSDLTLPQGLLYWRVQAIDPASNHVNFSPVRSFSNDQLPVSTAFTGTSVPSPVNNTGVGGATPFRWAPVNGAASYTIEVYKNDDSTHSPANLVISDVTKQASYVPQNFLPPSNSAYRWRVRWTDAGNQVRPWSADGRFFVGTSSVTLLTPAAGGYQKSNGLYFTWGAVPFAASYLVELKNASGGTVYSQSTAATAAAPSTIGDGVYQWRASALDPNGGVIAISAWRGFKIDSTKPTLTKYSPNPTGTPKSKVKILFSEKVKGVTTSSFKLFQKGHNRKLPAKVKSASHHKGALLIPKHHLKKGKTYVVKLSKAIHDPAGNHIVKFKWTFTV